MGEAALPRGASRLNVQWTSKGMPLRGWAREKL